MSNPADLKREYLARLTAFQESFTWEECNELVRSIGVVTGDMVETVFDPLTAARIMSCIGHILGTPPHRPVDWDKVTEAELPVDWREEWTELDAFNATAWSEALDNAHDLHAFAYFGILATWNGEAADSRSDAFRDPRFVADIVDHLEGFMALFPKDRAARDLAQVDRTCLAAKGRLKLDSGTALTVHELAALTGVTSKRLQNAIYAKTEGAPILEKDGLIPVESASRWLSAREYVPSMWREFLDARAWEIEDNAVATAVREDDDDEAPVEDFIFVPEARDGSIFSPRHCQKAGGGYTIGRKGMEQHFDDYDTALAALVAMPKPYWRRLNEARNFGIVGAERWRRVSRRELIAL